MLVTGVEKNAENKNLKDIPRGKDTAGIVGFNYRMTENRRI